MVCNVIKVTNVTYILSLSHDSANIYRAESSPSIENEESYCLIFAYYFALRPNWKFEEVAKNQFSFSSRMKSNIDVV